MLVAHAVLGMLLGCAAEHAPLEDSGVSFSYPLDDILRVNDLQAVGTHNSYHLRTEGVYRPEWDYDHLPLDQQADAQGVRQFELDLNWMEGAPFEVFHVGFLDETTTCRLLTDCLSTLKGWSDVHPGHHPLAVMLEVKDPWRDSYGDAYLAKLEAEVASVWPRDRVLAPDDVQGDADNVRDGLAATGWPTLGETRGKALFVLHTGDAFRARYVEDGTAGKLLFPDAYGDVTLPFAAWHSMNDPIGQGQAIAEVVAAGHLVRTRSDSDGNEARANDTRVRDAALASAAHFVSTDFPAPHPESGYVVSIPGGTPSGCNPLHASERCTSEAVEAPAQLGE